MAVAISGDKLADLGEDFRIVERLEIDKDEEDGQKEPGVADAVHDKGFRRGLGSRHLVVVVADQQIGTEPDPFPADEEHHIVVAHDQQQHRDHEEIHVGEESRESLFPMHVADRIDVDQEAHSRDDEQHDARERIDEKGQIDREVAAEDPLIGDDFVGRSGSQDVGKHADGAEERQAHRSPGQPVRDTRGRDTACRRGRSAMTASKREQRNELDESVMSACVTSTTFKRFISSTFVEIFPTEDDDDNGQSDRRLLPPQWR